VEKMLKEYSLKKIEEKLDLLLERKNIKSPAGWLRAALKNDYPPPSRGKTVSSIEYRVYSEEKTKKEMDSRFRGNDIKGSGNDISQIPSPPEEEGQGEEDKILSTEEVKKRFHSLREQLMVMKQ
jgi:hypothetical protein